MSGEAFGIHPKKKYDAKLGTGWPVDFTRVPPEDEDLWEQALAEAAKDGIGPVYYPGSIVQTCPGCGVQIFVGPRTQALVKADPEVVVKCMVCVVKTMGEYGGAYLHNLGNRHLIPRTY